MALGILTMFLGGKTTPSLTAAMTFLMVHSLYKSSLFLGVGIIDHQTGTRQIEQLGGLLRPMPITAFATATAAFSMAGFPLFFGFIGKEIMYKGALTEEVFPVYATATAVLSNSLMTAVAGILIIIPFLGGLQKTPKIAREAPPAMWLGPATMGSLGLIFGIVPDWIGRWLIEPAVRAIHPSMEEIQLKLFYGINEPLLLSIATLSLGAALYLLRKPLRLVIGSTLERIPLRFEQLYSVALDGLAGIARVQTDFLQSGSLHRYLSVIIGFVIVTVGVPLVAGGRLPAALPLSGSTLTGWLVVGIIALAVIVVVAAGSRLLAICCLGVVGAGVALLFLIYGAPDVALTQLLVETLTVVIVALVLLRLPNLNLRRPIPMPVRLSNAILAAAIGTLISALILTVSQTELDRSLTHFFEANSYIAAHGRNIVNVILVDFRSLDTLGEISVVALAGLAGYALIQARKVR
jgi:multicomponent Na+:H+ antiporter subunit A